VRSGSAATGLAALTKRGFVATPLCRRVSEAGRIQEGAATERRGYTKHRVLLVVLGPRVRLPARGRYAAETRLASGENVG